jgi:hypothetical protein
VLSVPPAGASSIHTFGYSWRQVIMTLKIFLNDKSFHCLKAAIPPASRAKLVLDEAVRLNFFGSNTVISCKETEARNLLVYASHCPGVVASINKALISAGLPLGTTE